MSDVLAVDFAALRSAYSVFSDQHKKLKDELESLATDLRAGLHKWEDDARDTFDTVSAEWKQRAETLAKALEALSRVIDGGQDNLRRAQQEHTQAWRG